MYRANSRELFRPLSVLMGRTGVLLRLTKVSFRPPVFTESDRLRGALWWDFDDLLHPLKSKDDQFELCQLGQLQTRQKPTEKGSLSTWSTLLANLLR